MNWLKYQDSLIFLVVPLVILTISEVRKNWHSLWDNNLTSGDRQLLMKAALFLLLPVVVFCHELGHALAILLFGGRVAEFHYGLLWGYVVPSGLFTPEQIIIIYLAGNVLEILIGLIALIFAAVVSSPPLVALLTYLGLWSIGGTAVIYTLMSFVGMYGDWQAIYSSDLKTWTSTIALCHVVLVLFFFYCIYGSRPKYWFAARTEPQWFQTHKAIQSEIAREPTSENYLKLAWSYHRVGLDALASQTLAKIRSIDANSAEAWLLAGSLLEHKGKMKEAIFSFKQAAESDTSDLLRAQAFMAIGNSLSETLDQAKIQETNNVWQQAMEAYTEAAAQRPDLADPRLFRARLLSKANMANEAQEELLAAEHLVLLDPHLKIKLEPELEHLKEDIT